MSETSIGGRALCRPACVCCVRFVRSTAGCKWKVRFGGDG